MPKPMFEMHAGPDGKIYFQLLDRDGKWLLRSRGFRSTADAIAGIDRVMRYGRYDCHYLRLQPSENQFSFVLKSPGGRTLGLGSTHPSNQQRDLAISAIRRALQFGKVLDLN